MRMRQEWPFVCELARHRHPHCPGVGRARSCGPSSEYREQHGAVMSPRHQSNGRRALEMSASKRLSPQGRWLVILTCRLSTSNIPMEHNDEDAFTLALVLVGLAATPASADRPFGSSNQGPRSRLAKLSCRTRCSLRGGGLLARHRAVSSPSGIAKPRHFSRQQENPCGLPRQSGQRWPEGGDRSCCHRVSDILVLR